MFLHRFAFIVLILIGFLPLTIYSQNGQGFSVDNGNYFWPINSGQYLSSTFGETRSAHFHSALDIKTWGRKGYEVYATRDAVLYRVAIGPKGYGKVIYLKHDDGSYSVYAHLLRFEDRIQKLVDSLRIKDYSFEIDRYLEHLNIEIKQGEVIALSGASGIGPPHLHFELRTPDHRPFNPLLTNLRVKDNIPPQFSNLSVEPLSITSEIEGKNRIYTKRSRKENNHYTFGTIDVTGPVGLGVDVFDQANDVFNAYAVYELKMYVNGEQLFHSKVDSFSYYNTNQMLIDRVYPILKESRVGYQRLYIADGNTLPFYKVPGKSGKLELPPGIHEVKIIANDYWGNASEANFRLRVKKSEEKFSNSTFSLTKKDTSLDTDNWKWFENWVNIPKKELSKLTIAELSEKNDSNSSRFYENRDEVRVRLNPARDIFFRASAREHFVARKMVPHSFSIVPSTTDNSFAAFKANTFYDTLSVGLTVQTFKPDSSRIRVLPSNQPLKKEYKLGVEIDSVQMDLAHLGLYSYDKRKDKLSYLSSTRRNNYLFAKPDELGTFFILRDTVAPVIKDPNIVRRVDGQWLVYATVTDKLSGIDYNRSRFFVNGIRGIAEYEPEDNRLVYYHPDFKPASSNELTIVVFDKEGHQTEETFQLSFDNPD